MLLLTAVLVCSSQLRVASADGLTDSELRSLLIAEIAQQHDVPTSHLRIGHFERVSRPLTNTHFYVGKVLDRATGMIFRAAIDSFGEVIDAGAADAAEAAMHRQVFGRLAPRLHEKLVLMADDDELTVALWLHYDSLEVPERAPISSRSAENVARPTAEKETADETQGPDLQFEAREANRRLRQQAGEMLAAQMRTLQRPVLDQLAEMGLVPTTVSRIAPLIYVQATKAQILQLAQLRQIDTIYPPNSNKSELATAKPTVKGDIVDIWNYEGGGVDVGVCERTRVNFLNPNLAAGTTRDATGDIGQHSTGVCGIIASSHLTIAGVAQDVTLFSANSVTWGDSNLSDAMDWAASTQNLDVINNSWGGNSNSLNLNEHDRHYDYIVRYLWSTVVKSAGNNNGGCGTMNSYVSSPGKGWNMITVGGYDDEDTLTWTDDDMYFCSSYVDPSTGCDKPEVVAPGEGITSTIDVSPWTGPIGNGTSYAAPVVAGLAADIMNVNSYFEVRPEVVKAIIMATALHNVQGAPRLSSQDGVGGVDMRAAVYLAHGGSGDYDWRSVSASTVPYDVNVDVEAGQRVRAVISWDSNANSGYTTDDLEADLDLRVYSPSGSFVTSSTSSDNSYEIVEFTASVSGSYRFNVNDFSFDGTTEYVGFACWVGNRILERNVAESHPNPDPARDTFEVDPALFWNVVALRNATGDDYDLHLAGGDHYGDPDAVTPHLANSASGTDIVEFVAIDTNHAPSEDYFFEVREWSATNNYEIEHSSRELDVANGEYGPFPLEPDTVVRIFDAQFLAGVTDTIVVEPSAGADVDVYLMQSDPSDPATHYLRRASAVASSTSGGPGVAETVSFTSVDTDWLGLVIINKSSTTGATFSIRSDTSAPTGSITINGGLAETGSHAVELTLVAEDLQTNVTEMRVRNAAGAFGAWLPFASSMRWQLMPGPGTRNVEVEYRNGVGLVSSFSDSIVVWPCPQPAAALTNGSFDVDTGFPWCFSDGSTNGFVDYAGGSATVEGGNDTSSGATLTGIRQRFTGTPTMEISFTWSYTSTDAPDFDYAAWDLIDVGTGSTLIGGPVDLTTTSMTTGIVSQVFSGSGTYEVRLGTRSLDNLAGPGITVFDDVSVVPVTLLPNFIRGDCNNDNAINIADAAFALSILFGGGGPAPCDDACDINDDSGFNIGDAVYLLSALFAGGAPPPAPNPLCGTDPTSDPLGCAAYTHCP